MEESEKEDSSEPSKENNNHDLPIIEELAGSLVDAYKGEKIQKHEDPFEEYAYQLKMRIQMNQDIFQQRFVHGYEILMQTLDDLK